MNRSGIYALVGVALLSVLGTASAADPYPQQQQYQPYPPMNVPLNGQPGGPHPMRTLFAATVAQVAQSTGNVAIVSLADGLTGALKGWFDNRRQRKGTNGALGNSYGTPMTTQAYSPPGTDAGQYPQTGYPQSSDPQTGYPQSGYPQTGYPQTSYPQTSYPQTAGQPSSYPQSAPAAYPQSSDPTAYPQSGAYPSPTSGGTYSSSSTPDSGSSGYSTGGYPAATGATPSLYAGIAYEIHLLKPDGSTAPVDAASYSFRTGDQFRVYYRPSLPGRVDVFNINPAGAQSQIDTSVVAAGELASLGPYQFTDLQGDETLLLKLSPCVTPTLTATTRSIVKVQGPAAGNAAGLGDCNATATRGIKARAKTRDIRKVTVEGGTSFALDPIAQNELGAGNLSPRQITITLHHR